ncbi:MAG: hypothetical protein NT072_10930 [Deltaproteobacteria bacterium]|nr:hypothetical protein [Deltaproteobacteria bacterium]
MKKYIAIVIAFLFIAVGLLSEADAQMLQLNDEDLAATYAAGFSNFSVTNGYATAVLNINASTYTEIDSLKLGYYNDGSTTGWDQDWEDVKIYGTPKDSTKDFTTTGLIIEAKFTNIDDPATRQLDYVKLGVKSATGDITANFISLSGDIDNGSDSTPEYNGHRITTIGNKTITFNSSEFEIKLSASGANKGFWVHFTNATVAP